MTKLPRTKPAAACIEVGGLREFRRAGGKGVGELAALMSLTATATMGISRVV